ncbi:MAG TPA: hypothetical protein VGG71_05995 [Chitinophagaceae bacterium]|jgi:uncharacterized membrane protein YphA (DoxX/SURF4 family)
MGNLSKIGRVFYAVAVTGTGFQTLIYNNFPYMLLPPEHFLVPGHVRFNYISGIILILVGACIFFGNKTRPISFLFGCLLLLIFCFFFIPYEFMTNSNYLHLAEWENALKELALAGGAFAIAGCFLEKNKKSFSRVWAKLIPYGAILFSIPIISFGILHFLYAKDVSTLVPSWVPSPIFWTHLAGAALLGSGIAIILKIKPQLIGFLLGLMILIWFIILHIPRVIVSPVSDRGDEMVSAFLALAYSGIAFVIAGAGKASDISKH